MTRIREINKSVHSCMQSQVKINTLSDVIRELVQNGVDAGAANININLKIQFLEKTIEVDYTDDGEGIDPKSMEDFGKRFFTSKLNSNSEGSKGDLTTLRQLSTFGFRGEAVNSLMNICSSMLVVSRAEHYSNGFQACFSRDVRVGNIVKSNSQVPVGTSIKMIGLFDPVVVRKKILLDNLEKSWTQDTFQAKKVILDSLLDKPWVKIKVTRQEFKGAKWAIKVLVDIQNIFKEEKIPFQSQMKLFNAIFGDGICEDYELCKVQFQNFQLKAGIGLSTLQTKNYQFIYLNGRPFISEELLKFINQKFQKNYELWGHSIKISQSKNDGKSSSMYGRPYSVNPVIVANFSTPTEVSELMQDPSKVCYTTKNLKILLSLFSKVIDVYFGIMKRHKKEKNKRETKEHMQLRDTKMESKRLKILDSAIISSEARISESKLPELNGRLTAKKHDATMGYKNKVYDTRKITDRLVSEGEVKTLKKYEGKDLTTAWKDTTGQNSDHCSTCYQVQKQEDLRKQSLFFNNIDKTVLTRNDLVNFHIIGQVDKKFILIRLQNRIIGFDQHAIDERINVEKMYRQLIELCLFGNGGVRLTEGITFETNKTENDLVRLYEDTLAFWGIRFDEQFNNITHLPLVILNKFLKIDYTVLRKGIIEFLYNLEESKKISFKLKEVKEFDRSQNPFWWLKYVSHMPEVYKETIKSKACRSSLMFGEQLSNSQVADLVQRLQQCYQPFECAHGRPSLYPICSISGSQFTPATVFTEL